MSSNSEDGNSATLDTSRYNLLVEFAIRHTAFHRAELESVLSIAGISIVDKNEEDRNCDADSDSKDCSDNKKECYIVDLPENDLHFSPPSHSDPSEPSISTSTSNQTVAAQRSFLILSFPMSSLGTVFRHEVASSKQSANNDASKANTKELPDIKAILSRCVLIRSVIELWGCGRTLDSCAQSVQQMASQGSALISSHQTQNRSWKITVHTLGSKYTRDEQNEMRSQFSFLNFDGPVQMEKPDDEYLLIREVALDDKGGPLYPRHGLNKQLIQENDVRPPLAFYFGRIVGGERNWRSDLEQYSLKKRVYLGPTSMDAELSLVMTNLAKVTSDSLAFDPFVGTGSILLSCGLRGARCVGTDIDLRVLRGDGKQEDVFSNFRQYNLPRPELIRSDNALYHRHYRHSPPLYDAIVTDPPYGIRAGARQSGSRRDVVRAVAEEHRHDHIAQTRPYAVSDVMADLLEVSARTLVMGGRLVYVIPSMLDFDETTDLPRHPCLRLVYTCYQPLSHPELGRRMVTMEKICEYDETKREEYLDKVWINGPESAEKCANIRERIIEQAKQKPDYEAKLAVRREKRKATKEAKKRAKREKGDNREQ